MGRKAISGTRKHNVLRMLLTDSERDELDTAAGDKPTSTWARDELLKIARRKRKRGKK